MEKSSYELKGHEEVYFLEIGLCIKHQFKSEDFRVRYETPYPEIYEVEIR